MATPSTGPAATTSNYTLPSNIKTTAQHKQEQENAIINGKGDEMGQTAFLTLFTTQLKNQNPLDPMDNTAFVSQLAQFSQLEATTKMSGSMESLVKSLSTSQIAGASALIGKTVGVSDGKAVYDGAPVNGFANLPNDVDSLTLKVYNSAGQLVRTGEVGAQKKVSLPSVGTVKTIKAIRKPMARIASRLVRIVLARRPSRPLPPWPMYAA